MLLAFFLLGQFQYKDYLLYISTMSLANHYLPLPITAMVYYMGQSRDSILLLALIGGLGTAAANCMEYYLLSHFQDTHLVQKLKKQKFFLFIERFFYNSPFFLLISVNILPIPIDPVRWLAVISQYDFGKFFMANFLGRTLRYALILALARSFPIPKEIIIYVGLALLSISIIKFTWGLLFQREWSIKKN
jgi:membrane protein YqaA with SNARE-associated domain